jgi:putative ABC transport system ATP-binding protein
LNDISKIIILDEPSNGLDTSTRDNITEYIKYLNEKGKTVILISHDDYFKNISDKILEFSPSNNPKYIK